MLIPMLSAIDKMLKEPKPDKIECARSVLSELIVYLKKDNSHGTNVPCELNVQSGLNVQLDKEAQNAQQELMSNLDY